MSLSPYTVLYLEDSDLDAELVLARLAKSDLLLDIQRACTRLEYEEKLRTQRFDVILSDYQVPGFNGVAALEMARSLVPETPFIFVSGAMGEELAIETMKQGATDYVLKQRLARLPMAIERAMGNVRERKARRASESAFADAQEKLRFAQEAAGMGVWELDLETRDIACSQICKQNLGLLPGTQITQQLLIELVHPDDRDRVSNSIQSSVQKQSDYDIEFRVPWPNGEIRWLNVRGRFIPGGHGRSARMSGVSLDITDRKRADEQLRASEAQFRAIVETNPECVKLVAADGTVLQMNRAGLRMVEATSLDEVIGHSVYPMIAAEYRDAFRLFHEMVCRGEGGRLEFDIIGLRGTRRHMETNAVPMKAKDGRLAQLAVTRDVTARKRAEEAVKRSELQFRQMAEQLPNMAWMAHPDGNIFWYNSRWYEYTGTTESEVNGWGWQRVHDPEVLPEVIACWKQALASGEPFEMVFPLRGSDGTFHPFLTLAHPFRGSDNEILYWFGSNTDISAQKQTEESLAHQATVERHRADLLAQLASASRTVNAVLSVESIITVLASESCRILGAQLSLVTINGRGDPPRPQTVMSMSDKYRELPEVDRDERIRFVIEAEHGIKVPLISHLGVQFGTIQVEDKVDGQFSADDLIALRQLANIAAVGIENARLYESLREQDKRKDEFLATLAHELRNPLAPLRNGLSILRLDPEARGGTLVDMMERQLSHMVRLIDDLLDISRISRNKMELRRAKIELSDVINLALETSRPLIEAAGHQLTVTIPSEPILINGDLTRLAQVFSNLLSNSAKYTDKGQITVTATRHQGEVAVSISDNGIGIPPHALGQIFDMFWQVDRSIERQTGGLGIGLALVKGIVEMHEGSISAHSAGHGQGSTFTVRLPILLTEGKIQVTSANDRSGANPQGPRRRILVVDDNVDSAKSMSMMLNVLGNDVATAYDGLQALEEVGRFQPEVILMDVGMPHLNGYEATRRIRESAHGNAVKIVALTGWGQEADRRRSLDAGCDAHLVKPVSLVDLNNVLSGLVESV